MTSFGFRYSSLPTTFISHLNRGKYTTPYQKLQEDILLNFDVEDSGEGDPRATQ